MEAANHASASARAPRHMFYVEVCERMCQTFSPPVTRYNIISGFITHFLDIWESPLTSSLRIANSRASHNPRLILRNVALRCVGCVGCWNLEHGFEASGVMKIMPTLDVFSDLVAYGTVKVHFPWVPRHANPGRRDRQGCRKVVNKPVRRVNFTRSFLLDSALQH